MDDNCKCNHGLTDEDTIYKYSASDVDICIKKIENIHFCPLCGKKLKKFGRRSIELKGIG